MLAAAHRTRTARTAEENRPTINTPQKARTKNTELEDAE